MRSADENGQANSTSDRLLRAAAGLFRERGYAASTTRELAQRLGIQKASLYYHFKKKEDVLYRICAEALTRLVNGVEHALDGEIDPRRRIEILIATHVETMLSDRDMNATTLFGLDALRGARRTAIVRLRDKYERLAEREVRGAQRSSVLRADVDARYLTLALMNMVNWTIVWYRPGGKLSPKALGKMLAALYVDGAGRDDQPERRGRAGKTSSVRSGVKAPRGRRASRSSTGAANGGAS